ncbi:hypothetical protein BH11ARM2_BH11ARM2_10000 [soil metagenome]
MGNGSWANTTLPYSKNIDILAAPGAPDRNLFDEDFNVPNAKLNMAYNGLLHDYSASAVNSPSQLPMLTEAQGNMNVLAYAYSNPYLECDDSSQPCHYVPSSPTCDGSNGTYSGMFTADASMWVYGNGQNVVFSDSSAKFRKLGGNINGKTDYRTDFYSAYDAQGKPTGQWQDTNFCHALLFQPDFDFQNFGTPVEWK